MEPPALISPTPVAMPGGNVEAYTFLCAAGAGFMAAWPSDDSVGYTRAWSAFSSDGISWNAAQQVSVDPMQVGYGTVSTAGNAAGFLVAWEDSSQNAYVSFSPNNGASIGIHLLSLQQTCIRLLTPPCLERIAGFMIAWVDHFF